MNDILNVEGGTKVDFIMSENECTSRIECAKRN